MGWEEQWAGRRGESRAVSNGEPANGADMVTNGSSVDATTLKDPIRRGAASVGGGGKGGCVVVESGTRDHDEEDTQRVCSSQQLDSVEGTEQPRKGVGSGMSKLRSWKSEIDTMDGRQRGLSGGTERGWGARAGRKGGALVHGATQ